MSVEREPLGTEPIIEVVSEDVILPVAESSVFSRTRDKFRAMDRNEKIDFGLAVAATLGGVALTTAAFLVEKRNPSSKVPTAMRPSLTHLTMQTAISRSAVLPKQVTAQQRSSVRSPIRLQTNTTIL